MHYIFIEFVFLIQFNSSSVCLLNSSYLYCNIKLAYFYLNNTKFYTRCWKISVCLPYDYCNWTTIIFHIIAHYFNIIIYLVALSCVWISKSSSFFYRKKEIEAELAEIGPLIEEARAAVGNIKTESLSEIRSLRAPPEVIRDILEGVLRLMGIQDTSWNSMKIFLAKRGVKEDIRLSFLFSHFYTF